MSGPASSATSKRARNDRGAVLFFVAIALPVLILLTAFAVDLGRQRSSRRTMQARADVIALDLVRQLGGRTENAILADPAFEAAVVASATRNNIERSKITYELGQWTPTGVDGKGRTGIFEGVLGTDVPTAVKVRAQDEIDYFFQPGSGRADRSAVAESEGRAKFSIGSYAAGLTSGNSSLLRNLVGDAVNTNLVGYEGLATSDVSLQLLGEELVLLGAIGSPDELFTSDVSMSDLMLASASALSRGAEDPDDVANVTLLQQYAAQVPGGVTVPVGDVLHVEQGGEASALDGSVNVLDLLTGSAFAANGTNALGAPQVGLILPGLGQVTAPCTSLDPPNPSPCNAVRVIEGPITIEGPKGTSDSTRQVAVRVGFQGSLGGLAGAKVQFGLDSAVGRGTIFDIVCGAPIDLALLIETGLIEADVTITLSVLGVPVTLIVSRSGGDTDELPHFDMPDDAGTKYEGGAGTFGLFGTQVQIQLPPGLGLLEGLVNTALQPVLTAVTGPTGLLKALDTNLMKPITDLFGLNIAGADVVPLEADCTNARLVG